MTPKAPPLVITALRKAYRSRSVLHDVSLKVDPGEVVILRGPNGSGKSTLLGCVCGTVIADAGQITIAGHDLANDPILARRALRYLPQEPEVPPGLTGGELLDLFAEIFGDPKGAEQARTLTGFGDSLDRYATTYSVGMRRLLMFAALLPGEHKLWVLDEPFAGVDAEGREKMLAVLRQRIDQGVGLVLAAHAHDDVQLQSLGGRTFELHRSSAAQTPAAPTDAFDR